MRTAIVAIAILAAAAAVPLTQAPGSADACAGLIGSNGNVNLGRTTTLAGYHDGVEHYVTSFEFQGGGGEFGTLIPLPDVPTKVERGGDWTLQRLQLETQTDGGDESLRLLQSADAVYGAPNILLETRIDALDLTVLEGGGASVAQWAEQHGFSLSPDAPEVLDFYAQRSPIFLAAVFDGDAAAERGQQLGDGTPVHLTIPTDDPWVPLRILGLGKLADDRVEADVFLLTDREPAILPGFDNGLNLLHNDQASEFLLNDLRADAGMDWVPESAWLSKIAVDSSAADLRYDLAIDATGANSPSPVDAGINIPEFIAKIPSSGDGGIPAAWLWAAGIAILGLFAIGARRAESVR